MIGQGGYITAGPESLEDFFQKGELFGQKAALNLWYVDTRPNSQKLFPIAGKKVNIHY